MPEPHCIASIRQSYSLYRCYANLDDGFDFRIEPMQMHRFVVLWISDKSYTVEPERSHNFRIPRFSWCVPLSQTAARA